jgi:hypothetical protein
VIAVKMLAPLEEEAKKRQLATQAKPGERADQRPCTNAGTLETIPALTAKEIREHGRAVAVRAEQRRRRFAARAR